jgi:type I restriction enzyme S subunit
MSSDWKECSLDDVAELTGGYAFKSSQYVDEGVFVLRTLNISDDGSIILNDAAFVSDQDAKEFSRFQLIDKDILFVMVGATLGKIGKVGKEALPALLNQNMWRIRAREKLADQDFLYYSFKESVAEIIGWASGSARGFLRRDDCRNLRMKMPSIEEQKAIAHILGTLDDKIELNRKTNETLEAMAKALFKSWFVDFDPVRAKAEGRPTGLPAEISDLFPDSFEDSELGEVPSGWAIGTIENIAEVIDCLHSKKPDQQEVGKQLLQLNNIEDNGLLNQSQKYFISADDYAKWSSRIEVEQGDCVITNVGRVGAVAQIPKGVKAAMGRNMTAIRTKGISPYPTFLLEYLLSAFGREEIRLNIDEGTILNALNVKNIPLLRFFRSPDSILNAYEKSARPLREAMESSLKENQALSTLRDALLPKLISGEIRIPDAEKILEEVGV